jgi:hypothetical protein
MPITSGSRLPMHVRFPKAQQMMPMGCILKQHALEHLHLYVRGLSGPQTSTECPASISWLDIEVLDLGYGGLTGPHFQATGPKPRSPLAKSTFSHLYSGACKSIASSSANSVLRIAKADHSSATVRQQTLPQVVYLWHSYQVGGCTPGDGHLADDQQGRSQRTYPEGSQNW